MSDRGYDTRKESEVRLAENALVESPMVRKERSTAWEALFDVSIWKS